MVTLTEAIIKALINEAPPLLMRVNCRNYKLDTDTCMTGCRLSKINKGETCTYMPGTSYGKYKGHFQQDCPCYK